MNDPQERLDELEHTIAEARDKAEDHGLIPDPDHEPRFHESGDDPRSKHDDDQTIAPG
jgi:hypothetical protein